MKLLRRILLTLLVMIVVVTSIFILNGYKLYQTVIKETSLADKVKIKAAVHVAIHEYDLRSTLML